MGRFSKAAANVNPFNTAEIGVLNAKDLGIQTEEIVKPPVVETPVVEAPKPTPKSPRKKEVEPAKEEIKTEDIQAEIEDTYEDLKRNPIIDLNDPQYKRVRRAYKRGNASQGRNTCTIYFTKSENRLIKDIAESYEMSVSELVRNVLINLKKADE